VKEEGCREEACKDSKVRNVEQKAEGFLCMKISNSSQIHKPISNELVILLNSCIFD